MSDTPHDRLDRALDALLTGAAPAPSDDSALVEQAAYLHALYAPLPMQVEARAALKARLLALHTTAPTPLAHTLVPTSLPRRPHLWQRPVALRLGLAAACLLITVGLSLAAFSHTIKTQARTSSPTWLLALVLPLRKPQHCP